MQSIQKVALSLPAVSPSHPFSSSTPTSGFLPTGFSSPLFHAHRILISVRICPIGHAWLTDSAGLAARSLFLITSAPSSSLPRRQRRIAFPRSSLVLACICLSLLALYTFLILVFCLSFCFSHVVSFVFPSLVLSTIPPLLFPPCFWVFFRSPRDLSQPRSSSEVQGVSFLACFFHAISLSLPTYRSFVFLLCLFPQFHWCSFRECGGAAVG